MGSSDCSNSQNTLVLTIDIEIVALVSYGSGAFTGVPGMTVWLLLEFSFLEVEYHSRKVPFRDEGSSFGVLEES